LTKTDNGTLGLAGSDFTFFVNVTNYGPSDAQQVNITDTIPANSTFVSATDGGVYNGTHVNWPTIPTLSVFDSVQYNITININSDVEVGTIILNIANVTTITSEIDLSNNGDDQPVSIVILEGHTPGFYKNNWDKFCNQSLEAPADGPPFNDCSWVLERGDDNFTEAFGLSDVIVLSDKGKKTFDDPNLRQALDANGGGVNALARHCVAAKLNAEHDEINYPIQLASTVISLCAVQFELYIDDNSYTGMNTLKNLLDSYNNYGSDVDQHWPN
jgi:uncharacterized repeat protein (TIGR01451 family)